MFLIDSDIYVDLEKTYSFIDSEIGQYFKKIESSILDFINKRNNIYKFQKSDILKRSLSNEDFEEFLSDLISEISDRLNDNYFDVSDETFNIDIDSISQFNMNSTLHKQYGFSYHLAKNVEKSIDETISKHFFSGVSNGFIGFFLDNLSPADVILSFTNLSSNSFNNRHKNDIQSRIKGILLNFKIRLKNELKSQVYGYLLSIQKSNIKTA